MSLPVTSKQEVAQLLAQLPDDATLEDIQYHVYVLEKIQRGRAVCCPLSTSTIPRRLLAIF
ncbi:MAG: hypothetical protein ACYDCY_06290 [Metallibacterium sp.]